MKSKLEIYALSVCFAAIVCLMISIGIAGYSIIQIAAPKLTMRSYEYKNYQANDTYWKSGYSCNENEKEKAKTRPSEEVLTKQRLAAFALLVEAEQREGLQLLVKCFMFIFVSSIVLFVHWRIAKNARKV
jgi:hypothetical protein